MPDLEVEMPALSDIAFTLLSEQLIFDYATIFQSIMLACLRVQVNIMFRIHCFQPLLIGCVFKTLIIPHKVKTRSNPSRKE